MGFVPPLPAHEVGLDERGLGDGERGAADDDEGRRPVVDAGVGPGHLDHQPVRQHHQVGEEQHPLLRGRRSHLQSRK